MVNKQMSIQMITAHAPTTMLDTGNTKKGVKNLPAKKKGPTHSKKERTVDGKKNLCKQLNINTRR